MVCLDSLGVYELPVRYSKHHTLTGSCHVDKIRGPTPKYTGTHNHQLFSNLKQGFPRQPEEKKRSGFALSLQLSSTPNLEPICSEAKSKQTGNPAPH